MVRKLFQRKKKELEEVEPVAVVVDETPKVIYPADISSIIKYVTDTPFEEASTNEYFDADSQRLFSGYTTYLTMVFSDKVVMLEMTLPLSVNGDISQKNSVIKVFKKDASPQLDLFDEVPRFPLVGGIRGSDVSPEQFRELRAFMTEAVNADRIARKKMEITTILGVFE